jgi:hypothetical protein
MGRAGLALAALTAVAVLSVLLVGVDVRGNFGGSGWGSEGEIAGGVGGRGGAVELLDWWKPTIADTVALKEKKSASPSGPSASKSSGSKKEGSRGRVAGTISSGSGAPATVPVMKGGGNGATSGQVDKVTKYYDDMTARSIEPSEYDDDEDISEGELAGRLGRAIDAHEKCRRHWPHLEKLEAAQEIRVHDARNNLEVANRGMERARKELSDAENLVMAARSVRLLEPLHYILPFFSSSPFSHPFFERKNLSPSRPPPLLLPYFTPLGSSSLPLPRILLPPTSMHSLLCHPSLHPLLP